MSRGGGNRAVDPEKVAWMRKQTCPRRLIDSAHVGRRDLTAGDEPFPVD